MSDPTQPMKAVHGASVPANVEHLSNATGSLAQAVAAREETKVATLLDDLSKCLVEKPWKSIPVDALVVAWTLCGEVLDAGLSDEVTAHALVILHSLAGFCNLCKPVFEDPVTQLNPRSFTSKITACMTRSQANLEIQGLGCALLSALAGCLMCPKPHSAAMQNELAAGAAIETLTRAIDAVCVSIKGGAKPTPAHISVLEGAVPALYLMTKDNAAIFDTLAASGPSALLLAALKIAGPDFRIVGVYAMQLLHSLAPHSSTTAEDIDLINAALWQTMKDQCKKMDAATTFAVMQTMPDLMAVSISKGLDMDGKAVEMIDACRHILKTHENKDDPLIAHCLQFIAVASNYAETHSAINAALSSPTLPLELTTVASQSLNIWTQFKVLGTLFAITKGVSVQPDYDAACHIADVLQDTAKAKETPAMGTLLLNGYGLTMLAVLLPAEYLAENSAVLLELASRVCQTLGNHDITLLDSEDPDAYKATAAAGTKAIPYPVLEKGMSFVVNAALLAEGCGINATDASGQTLLHRFAAMRDSRCLAWLLERAGSKVDLLVRTRGGANALQLARQSGHTECEALLLDITQKAAEDLQEALLKELESSSSDVASRKSRKKKNNTRGASFATNQLEAKTQKVGEGEETVEDALAAEEARLLKEKLKRQQELEEEYERALELRRVQLAEEKKAQEARVVAQVRLMAQEQSTQSMATSSDDQDNCDTDDMSTSSGAGGAPVTVAGSDMRAHGGSSSNCGTDSVSGDGDADTETGMEGSDDPSSSTKDVESIQGADASAAASPFLAFADAAGSGSSAGTSLFADLQQSLSGMHTQQQAPLRSPSLFEQVTTESLFGGLSPSAFNHPSSPSQTHQLTTSASMPLGGSPMSGHDDGLMQLQRLGSMHTGNMDSMSVPSSQFQSPVTIGGMLGLPASTGGLTMLERPVPLTGSLSPNAPNVYSDTETARMQRVQELQDALFVHDTTADVGQQGPSAAAAFAVDSGAEASLFASLRDSVASKAAANGALGAGTSHSLASSDSSSRISPRWVGGGTSVEGMEGLGFANSVGTEDSDESAEPTRHLWIGNLGTRTLRSVLKNIFERFGYVDDVVTFPGRMYAFVNYRNTSEAITAFKALNGKVLPDLSNDRPLLLKFRPAKKATAHLRALSERLDSIDGDELSRLDVDKDGNCTEPSPRIWLGNIAPTASTKSLQTVLSRFGPLTDAAVFPARIGPLGYAFVKFERMEDAVSAFEGLNNTVVPALSGTKQLKMRYKPAAEGPIGRDDVGDSNKAGLTTSRHLWLGNVTQKPTDEIIAEVFKPYGHVDSVRIFAAKAYAFVNFSDPEAAHKAMLELDGTPVPCLTGVKPLVMRYQQEGNTTAPKLPGLNSSESQSSLGSLGLVGGGGPIVGMNGLMPGLRRSIAGSEVASSEDGGLLPIPGLAGLKNLDPSTVAALAGQLRFLNSSRTGSEHSSHQSHHQHLHHQNHSSGGMLISNVNHMTEMMGGGDMRGSLLNHPDFNAQQNNTAAAAAAAAAATASAAQFASLMGMQPNSGASPLGMDQTPYGGDMLGLGPRQQQHLAAAAAAGYQHQQNQTTGGNKLNAVLNNLMALQRANSVQQQQQEAMQQQLLRFDMQQQQLQVESDAFNYNFGGAVRQQQPDIAGLSALLANQSLHSTYNSNGQGFYR